MQRYFAVRDCPGAGLGAFATRDIQPGERILAEEPLVSWASSADATSGRHDWALLDKEVGKLSVEKRGAFYALSQSPHYGMQKTAFGIWSSNAFATPAGDGFGVPDDGVRRSAAFALCCRFNHACAPSAHVAWNSKRGQQTVHALRRIRAGEQITIAYYGGDKPGHREARRAALKEQYGFDCQCQLCGLKGNALEESESRQRHIATIHASLLAFPPSLPELVESLLTALTDEGSPLVWATSPMFAALLEAKQRGDVRAAADWARRGADVTKLALGTDHRLHDKFQLLATRLSAATADKRRAAVAKESVAAKPPIDSETKVPGNSKTAVGAAAAATRRSHVDPSGLIMCAHVEGVGSIWCFAAAAGADEWRAAGRRLAANGFATVQAFLGAPLALALRQQSLKLFQTASGEFTHGRVGGGVDGTAGDVYAVTDVRGDRVLNLDTQDARVPLLKQLMEKCTALLRTMANEADADTRPTLAALKRVSQRSRPMLAVYPGGGTHYLRHVDNPDGNGRLLVRAASERTVTIPRTRANACLCTVCATHTMAAS